MCLEELHQMQLHQMQLFQSRWVATSVTLVLLPSQSGAWQLTIQWILDAKRQPFAMELRTQWILSMEVDSSMDFSTLCEWRFLCIECAIPKLDCKQKGPEGTLCVVL